MTQTVKVTLEPVMFDEDGQPLEFLIDAAETQGGSPGGPAEVPLDGPGDRGRGCGADDGPGGADPL